MSTGERGGPNPEAPRHREAARSEHASGAAPGSADRRASRSYCEQARSLLELRPLGLLESDQEVALLAHLSGCTACAAEDEALRAAYADVRVGADEVAQAPLPAGAKERAVESALAAREEEQVTKLAKAVVLAGPAIDPDRIEAIGRRIALSCSYCHARTAREEVVFCATCLAPHHDECWRMHGRCSLAGCVEVETVRPGRNEPRAERRPRRLRGIVVSLGFIGASGVAALTVTLVSANRREVERQRVEQLELVALTERQRAERERAVREEEAARLAQQLAARERQIAELKGSSGARVSLQVENIALTEVAVQLGRQAGQNILVDPAVSETVTLSLRDVPWEEALEVVARLSGCEVEQRGGRVWLLTQVPKVTIQFTDANTRTVLQLLSAYAGLNLVIGPDELGRVSVDLREEAWDAALATVAHAAGSKAWTTGENLVYVGSVPPQGAKPLIPGQRRPWPVPSEESPTIDVDLVDAAPEQALQEIARAAGRKLELRGALDPTRRIELKLARTPWRVALELAAQRAGCLVEHTGEGAIVRATPKLTRLVVARTTLACAVTLLDGCELDGGRRLNVVVPGPLGRRSVELDLKQLEPLEALQALASATGCKVVGDPPLLRLEDAGLGATPERAQEPPGALGFEGMLVFGGAASALIAGRVYRVGDSLLDPRTDAEIAGSALVELVTEERLAKLRLASGKVFVLELGSTMSLDADRAAERSPPFATRALGIHLVLAQGGLEVREVLPDSAAARAGIQVGDLLTDAAREDRPEWWPLRKLEDFTRVLDGQFAGDDVLFIGRRGERPLRVAVRLGPPDFERERADSGMGWHARGLARARDGRWRAAIEAYDRALLLEPLQGQIHFERGNARSALSEWREALADYDRALELDPNAPWTQSARTARARAAAELAAAAPPRPFLGIVLEETQGRVAIDSVLPISPAGLAGIEVGDVLESVVLKDGRVVTLAKMEDLAPALAGQAVGDEVTLVGKRGEEPRRWTVILEARPGH